MKKKLLILAALLLLVALIALPANAADELPETCPHCGVEVTEWMPLTEADATKGSISGNKAGAAAAKHYYLAFEGDSIAWKTTAIPRRVCIYMNGKTLIAEKDVVFNVTGGILSLIGEGTVMGKAYATGTKSYGGAIQLTETDINNGRAINIYGTTVTTTGEEGRTAAGGGVISLSIGTLNLHSGSVEGGHAKDGGTLYVGDGATANIYNGSIGGGTTTNVGGSIYVAEGGNLNVEGGEVLAGTSGKNGGTVYHSGASFTMSGGKLTGGTSGNAGGAVYVATGCTFEMSGGSIAGGTAKTIGDCVYIPSGAEIILSGSASIEELKFNTYDPARLLVKGKVTGKVTFSGQGGQAVDGFVIGRAEEVNTLSASYTVSNTELYVVGKGTDLVVSSIGMVDPVTVTEGYCDVCKKDVSWMAYGPSDYENNTYLYSGHYYIDSEDTVCNWKQKFIVGSDTVCLDLRGKTLVANSRAFDVTKGVLNIMDTVGGGVVTGCGPSNVNSVYGGTFFVRGPSTLNLYGGKLTYTIPTDGRSYVTRGGVVYSLGTVNIYGGEISGGAAGAGANVYIDADKDYVGHLGIYGGTIGKNVKVPGASTSGPCAVCRGTAHISGTSFDVVELMLTASDYSPVVAERITMSGKVSGKIKIDPSTYNVGMDIGTALDVDLSEATRVTIEDDATAKVIALDGQLFCVREENAALVRKADGTAAAYSTAADAIAAATVEDLVILLKDAADLTISQLTNVDLNGFNINNVYGTGILNCKDNKTDDFDVTDGVYGRITGEVTCTVSGAVIGVPYTADNYIMITETDGVSFHCVRLEITHSAMRPSCAGIYYISDFYGDEKVVGLVSQLGVVLNASEQPTLTNMETTSKYTELGAEGFNTTGTSCLLSGIMKTTKSDADNQAHAGITVYAAPYLRLTNGTVIFGATKSTSMKEQMSYINGVWPYLKLTQKKAVVSMAKSFEPVMRDASWNASNPLSILDREVLFTTTDYTPYLAPWTHDVVAEAMADGKIHYYFMAGEGLHISDSQTYKDKWGDSYLMVFPNGQTMLVDTGPLAYAPVLAENLKRMGITHLDVLLVTHPHSDHHNGAFSDSALINVGLLENITVDQVYFRGGTDPESTTVDLVSRVCRDLNIPCDIIEKGDVLTFGDVRIECVWPLVGAGTNRISGGEEINNMSIVLRLDYGEHSSLLTGDLYVEGEKMILERVDHALLDVDFLKVPHHGYNTSSSVDFLEAISPELAMSIGRLPIPSKVYERYETLGIDFLDDRKNGYVEVIATADGTMEYETSRTEDNSGATPDTGDGTVEPDGSED